VFLASSSTCEWDQCGSEKGRMEEKGFDKIPRQRDDGGAALLLTTERASPARHVPREIGWDESYRARSILRQRTTTRCDGTWWEGGVRGCGLGAGERRGTAASLSQEVGRGGGASRGEREGKKRERSRVERREKNGGACVGERRQTRCGPSRSGRTRVDARRGRRTRAGEEKRSTKFLSWLHTF
jgi:hypothetical protein